MVSAPDILLFLHCVFVFVSTENRVREGEKAGGGREKGQRAGDWESKEEGDGAKRRGRLKREGGEGRE